MPVALRRLIAAPLGGIPLPARLRLHTTSLTMYGLARVQTVDQVDQRVVTARQVQAELHGFDLGAGAAG
jgi:hypothetical protein